MSRVGRKVRGYGEGQRVVRILVWVQDGHVAGDEISRRLVMLYRQGVESQRVPRCLKASHRSSGRLGTVDPRGNRCMCSSWRNVGLGAVLSVGMGVVAAAAEAHAGLEDTQVGGLRVADPHRAGSRRIQSDDVHVIRL